MIEQLRQRCHSLLEEGTVDVIIGYGESGAHGRVHPVFVSRPEDVHQLVWNDRCFSNLTVYLTRTPAKAFRKPAILVKGCDERALVVLEQENQIDRSSLHVIGMACDGVGTPREPKCAACDVRIPRFADETIGEVSSASTAPDGRYAEIEAFLQKTPAERLAYWTQEFTRCLKCYACREVCPTCYCNRCLVDKNRPVCIDTSATLKGNFAWHIARAFHQAGRCTECGECTRVCPAGINLRLLNQSLARAADKAFAYRAGMDRSVPPIIGSFDAEDKEEFIR